MKDSKNSDNINEYRSNIKPTWCNGCFNYILLNCLTNIFLTMKMKKNEINIISGIGCSSRLPLFLNTFGMHGVHGRAIPIAIGSRLTNPNITTIVTAGDGDLFSIGIGHFVHAARKNFNITVICIDNKIYAMTKNQASPTSDVGYKGSLTPYGKIGSQLNVLEFALACNAGFVAQVSPLHFENMKEIIMEAINYHGFSFINVLSPCILHDQNQWRKENFVDINLGKNHDPDQFMSAMEHASKSLDYVKNKTNKIPIGIYYKNRFSKVSFEKGVKELKTNFSSQNVSIDEILSDFRCLGKKEA